MGRKKFLFASAAVFVSVGALLSSGVYALYGADSPGMYLLVSFIGALTLVPAVILVVFGIFTSSAETEAEAMGSSRVSPLFLVLLLVLLAVFLYYRSRYGLTFW